MHQTIVTTALLLVLCAGTAHANPSAKILVETDAAKIVAQQTALEQDVRSGRGTLRDLDRKERERLLLLQQRVVGMLDGRASTTELPPSDQLSLFNDLEEISALINKAEDERMICERTRPIGSNRPVSVCKTVAQRREEREQSIEGRRRDSRCLTACGNVQKTEGW